MIEYMLTTIDNPYDPFDDFENWFLYDSEKGYNSCGYLSRVVDSMFKDSEKDETEKTNAAIDEIIKNDFLNIYKRVSKTTQ